MVYRTPPRPIIHTEQTSRSVCFSARSRVVNGSNDPRPGLQLAPVCISQSSPQYITVMLADWTDQQPRISSSKHEKISILSREGGGWGGLAREIIIKPRVLNKSLEIYLFLFRRTSFSISHEQFIAPHCSTLLAIKIITSGKEEGWIFF